MSTADNNLPFDPGYFTTTPEQMAKRAAAAGKKKEAAAAEERKRVVEKKAAAAEERKRARDRHMTSFDPDQFKPTRSVPKLAPETEAARRLRKGEKHITTLQAKGRDRAAKQRGHLLSLLDAPLMLVQEQEQEQGGYGLDDGVTPEYICDTLVDELVERTAADPRLGKTAAQEEATDESGSDDDDDAEVKQGGATFDAFLKDPKHRAVYGNDSKGRNNRRRARAIAVGGASECCVAVVRAWLWGETGRDEAKHVDEKAQGAKEDAVRAAMLLYRGELARGFSKAATGVQEATAEPFRFDANNPYYTRARHARDNREFLLESNVMPGHIATTHGESGETALKPRAAASAALVKQPSDVLAVKDEIFTESFAAMSDEADRVQEKLDKLQRMYTAAQMRQTAARGDAATVTPKALSMTGRDRWTDMKKRLPGEIRELYSCAEKLGKADAPSLASISRKTASFDAVKEDFFTFLKVHGKKTGNILPSTDTELCGMLYPLCHDHGDAAVARRTMRCQRPNFMFQGSK